jgi:hypothetical protein
MDSKKQNIRCRIIHTHSGVLFLMPEPGIAKSKKLN